MIEAGNQELREDLQWLADRGVIDLSTSTWPLPVAAVEAALEGRKKKGLSRGDVHAILAVRRYLDDQQKTLYGFTAQINTDSIPQLGFAEQSKAKAGGGVYLQAGGDHVAGKLQVNGLVDSLTQKQSTVNLQGSYVAGRALGQVLYVGQLAHFWGPGQDGSLNWGNAATAIPGIGLQRENQKAPESKWLGWIGPWGYDIFAGQLQNYSAVPRAKVFNMRVFARPLRGLEVGASRFIQWGGQGRNNSLGALWDAVKGNSNEQGVGADPSNELAGIDVRYTFGLGGNPLTVYGQLAGEDEAGGLPSHFLAQVGTQYKHMWGSNRLQWYAEASDTTARRVFGMGEGMPGTAYRHGVYTDGLYHEGLPIGHPIGGTGRMLSAGVSLIPDDFRYFSRFSVRILQANVNNTSQPFNEAFPKTDRMYGGELAASWKIRPLTFRAGLTLLRSKSGDNDKFGVLVSVNVPLGTN